MNETTPKPSPIGDALRTEIKRRGLTAYRVAKLAGISIDPVDRFMKAQRGLTLASVDAIAHALGLALVQSQGGEPS
jgi:transcriptional regulator with XRE-family HTH domain